MVAFSDGYTTVIRIMSPPPAKRGARGARARAVQISRRAHECEWKQVRGRVCSGRS